MNMRRPLRAVALANTLCNTASKSIPAGASPRAVLGITYPVSSFLPLIAFFIFEDNRNFLCALHKLDWTGLALGLSGVFICKERLSVTRLMRIAPRLAGCALPLSQRHPEPSVSCKSVPGGLKRTVLKFYAAECFTRENTGAKRLAVFIARLWAKPEACPPRFSCSIFALKLSLRQSAVCRQGLKSRKPWHP